MQATAAASHIANQLIDAGMLDDSGGDNGDAASPCERASKEEAKTALDDWLELKVLTSICTR